MPSLNPNTNFELILLERKSQLRNPFETDFCKNSCERVINFLATIQDKFANKESLELQKIDGEEFFICMPTIEAFASAIYLFEAIPEHAIGNLDDTKLKEFLVKFVEAHTVIWTNGIPSAKIGFYGNWTRKTEMFEITLLEASKPTNNKAIVNDLQMILIDRLWQKKDCKNSIKARKI